MISLSVRQRLTTLKPFIRPEMKSYQRFLDGWTIERQTARANKYMKSRECARRFARAITWSNV